MKIIHNLLFSIYFWANSLHTQCTHRHTDTHTHAHTPVKRTARSERVRGRVGDTLRSFVHVHILRTPKRFSLLSSGLAAKSAEMRTVMLVHHRTHRRIDNNSSSDGNKKTTRAAAAPAKWNFHSTFILFFELRDANVAFLFLFFLVQVRVFALFFVSHCLRRELTGHAEMLMLIWLLFKYFTKDRMIYFDFFPERISRMAVVGGLWSKSTHCLRTKCSSAENVDFGFVMLYVFCNGLTVSLRICRVRLSERWKRPLECIRCCGHGPRTKTGAIIDEQ